MRIPKILKNLGIWQGSCANFLNATSDHCCKQGARNKQKIRCKADATKNQIFKYFRYKLFPFFLTLCALGGIVLSMPSEKPKKIPFSLKAISSQIPHHPEWESNGPNEKVGVALSQPYRYLGSGGQCYTFASADERFVVKFFKQKAFAVPSSHWFKEKKTRKMDEKRNKIFQAFKHAHEDLFEETQVLFVHLNPTSNLNKTLEVEDSIGQKHLLDLDPLEFVVQRKADMVTAVIKDTESAKQVIDKVLALNLSLYRKGFYNRDPNFRSNYGFIGEQAILIDVGRVVCNNDKNFEQIVLKSTKRFKKYLAANYSQLLPYFDNCIAKILAEDNNRRHESSF